MVMGGGLGRGVSWGRVVGMPVRGRALFEPSIFREKVLRGFPFGKGSDKPRYIGVEGSQLSHYIWQCRLRRIRSRSPSFPTLMNTYTGIIKNYWKLVHIRPGTRE